MSKQLDSILGRVTNATPNTDREKEKMPEAPTPRLVSVPLPTLQREMERPLQAMVPASVERAVKIRAAEEGTTVRTLILKGLKAIGIDVPEEELRDRRR
jgi:hypothetical protein